MTDKKVRIELRYDPVKDKDIIDFIDTYGSTRAGFIKNIIKIYKNQMEADNKTIAPVVDDNLKNKSKETKKDNKRKKPMLGQAFSSKDFN